jgi:hypothetical protein
MLWKSQLFDGLCGNLEIGFVLKEKKVDQISGGDNLLFFEILGMTSNEGDKQDLLHGADILQAMWC